jgi:hypothetical protein
MAGTPGAPVRGQATETLELTQDEAAVIRLIRQTPYGQVIVKMHTGAITGIERNQTFVPPSLKKEPKLLGKERTVALR